MPETYRAKSLADLSNSDLWGYYVAYVRGDGVPTAGLTSATWPTLDAARKDMKYVYEDSGDRLRLLGVHFYRGRSNAAVVVALDTAYGVGRVA